MAGGKGRKMQHVPVAGGGTAVVRGAEELGVGLAPWWDRLVRGIAHNMAGQLGEPEEDLYGAAALRIVQKLPSYRPADGELRAFVIAHARYAMVDHVRNWRHCRRVGFERTEVVHLNGQAIATPARQLEMVMAGEAWGALAQLPARWAAVMRAYYGEGLLMRECGERWGVKESRVSQIHKAAIKRLRAAMGVV